MQLAGADSPVFGAAARWARGIAARYFDLVIVLTLTITLASFVRERGQLLSNISLWLFGAAFLVSIRSIPRGFLVSVFLLTVSPSLHEQINSLVGVRLHAWAFPGVDCVLGFVAAWTLKGGLGSAREALGRFPSGPMLCLHSWIALSAVFAVCRNIWQSSAEYSLRGLVYNVWLIRGISWHDDYYPLQDLFFYSAALAVFMCSWVLLIRHGERMFRALVAVMLAGAATNVVFAMWQKVTGKGWVNGKLEFEVNALWPDLHSFGGFMAVVLLVCCGCLAGRSLTGRARALVVLGAIVAAVGLYLSTSRSTLLLVCSLLVLAAVWSALTLRGWQRIIPLVVVAVVMLLLDWMLDRGYRGVSYASLRDALKVINAASLNAVLSQRPEIWSAALGMYLGYPLFGLGQGAFYRLSAVREFSGSEALVSLGGSGAHNYFLQTFVELGLVGLAIALFIAVPFARLGRQNVRLVSFYALTGVAVANLYAHSLLVRETLMLAAVFAAAYVWEAETVGAARWQPPGRRTVCIAAFVLVGLAVAALVEFGLSFNRFPFVYGQRCHEVRLLGKDGWTEGSLRVAVPAAATVVHAAVIADRPDLERRPLEIEVAVVNGKGAVLLAETYSFTDIQRARDLAMQLPSSSDGSRFLELKPSHCYVPLDLGVTYDPRRLGVRVRQLHFYSSSDTKTLGPP